MAAKCPSKSHPDYKLMVELFGEDNALYLYDAFDQNIPNREQIAKIYKQNYGKELPVNNTEVQYQNNTINRFCSLWGTCCGNSQSSLI